MRHDIKYFLYSLLKYLKIKMGGKKKNHKKVAA